jgi:hypothetical protein
MVSVGGVIEDRELLIVRQGREARHVDERGIRIIGHA